jgi:hypothetical protein
MTTLGHRINHVKLEGREFLCEHCGTRYAMAQPAPVTLVIAASSAFLLQHKWCQRVTQAEVPHV